MVREKLKMDPILTAQEQATEVAVAALKIKTVEMIPRNEETGRKKGTALLCPPKCRYEAQFLV